MLKHIVMWRFADGANGKTRAEHAQWMQKHLTELKNIVPEIVSIEVGVNTNTSDAAYDAVLISVFEDKNALERYKNHPEHQKISQYCKAVRESRTVVDYEI